MAHYAAAGCDVHVLTCTLGEEGEVIPAPLAHLAADRDDALGAAPARGAARGDAAARGHAPRAGGGPRARRPVPLPRLGHGRHAVRGGPTGVRQRGPVRGGGTGRPAPARRTAGRRRDLRRARRLRPPRPHPHPRGHHGCPAAAGPRPAACGVRRPDPAAVGRAGPGVAGGARRRRRRARAHRARPGRRVPALGRAGRGGDPRRGPAGSGGPAGDGPGGARHPGAGLRRLLRPVQRRRGPAARS